MEKNNLESLGEITLFWVDGYAVTKPIGGVVRGLIHGTTRPIAYRFNLNWERLMLITNSEIVSLTKWFRAVEMACDGFSYAARIDAHKEKIAEDKIRMLYGGSLVKHPSSAFIGTIYNPATGGLEKIPEPSKSEPRLNPIQQFLESIYDLFCGGSDDNKESEK